MRSIKNFRRIQNVSDMDMVKFIPTLLTYEARVWSNSLVHTLTTLNKFFQDLRIQYGILDFQMKLEDELRGRTQAYDENILTFIWELKLIMEKVEPPMSLK